jgi:hypothetical protein
MDGPCSDNIGAEAVSNAGWPFPATSASFAGAERQEDVVGFLKPRFFPPGERHFPSTIHSRRLYVRTVQAPSSEATFA